MIIVKNEFELVSNDLLEANLRYIKANQIKVIGQKGHVQLNNFKTKSTLNVTMLDGDIIL